MFMALAWHLAHDNIAHDSDLNLRKDHIYAMLMMDSNYAIISYNSDKSHANK